MAADDRNVFVDFGARIGALQAGLSAAVSEVEKSTTAMKETLEGFQETVQKVQGAFIALTVALAGTEAFEHMVDKTVELGEELIKTSQRTGIEVEQLSALRFASGQTDVAFGDLTTSLQRFSRNVFEASTGNTKAAEALKALGIETRNSDGTIRPMNDLLLDVAQKFSEIEDGAGKTALSMELFGRGGASIIPFLNEGRSGIEALTSRARELGLTMSEEGARGAKDYGDKVKELKAEGEALEREITLALLPALKGLTEKFIEWGKPDGALASVTKNIKTGLTFVLGDLTIALNSVTAAFAAATGSGVAFAQSVERIRGAIAAETAATATGDTVIDLIAGQKDRPTPSKRAAPTLPDPNAAKRAAAERKKEFEERLEEIKTEEVAARDASNERLAAAMRETDMVAEFFGTESVEYQRALQHELEVRRAVEKEREKIAKEEAKFEAEGFDDMLAHSTAVLKKLTKEWNDVFNGVTRTIDQMVTGVLRGTQTLSTAFHNLWADFLLGSINAGLQAVQHWAATELAKKNITVASVAERVAAESWGAVQTVAVNAWAALTSMANYAWSGVAAAWAAISAIPVIGPFLAPGVALATGAAILALAGNIRSAAQGFDVPSGLNPVTQLHSQEMVLPADLANKVRNMTGGGGSGITVYAMDASSFRQWALQNRSVFGDVTAQNLRDNHTALKKALG